ncbi:hypothetical protein [Mycolicibacterium phocaicum]|uniref:hypothetical protein n=1 Tax=Mycolicibacterium phocaicum TaxID=319706 RepID=UPI0009274B80|nr:hypothetical protein [Mycolicibacterium phocaicum]UCZ62873.1 hypothetical protein LHJ73_12205 [Mycolicibacterium phocaicum]SHV58140.1 Uncharacterised protein [Mycobacteroides abscessus subsp. abscessus]
MSKEARIFGRWQSAAGDNSDLPLRAAVIGSRDGRRFALVIDTGDGWTPAVRLNSQESAEIAAERIDRLATQPEHARIGEVENNWGQGTPHPGIEWIAAASEDRSLPFQDRLALGMKRLWIVPSTDGQTFGLLAPDTNYCELGLFESEAAALRTVHVIDTLVQRRW